MGPLGILDVPKNEHPLFHSFPLGGLPWSQIALFKGREQSFLLPCSTSSEGASSLSTFLSMDVWVSQTSFVLCGCSLLEYECLFHCIMEGRVHQESSLHHDADFTLHLSFLIFGYFLFSLCRFGFLLPPQFTGSNTITP